MLMILIGMALGTFLGTSIARVQREEGFYPVVLLGIAIIGIVCFYLQLWSVK